MPGSRTGIVVVNWNGAERSAECLRSLLTLDVASDALITLVDNGSSDGSAHRLQQEFPTVDVLALLVNGGYASACNAGVRHVQERGADYVWLLNNDTIVAPAALAALVSASREHDGRAIVCPKILRRCDDGFDRIWSAGGALRWPWLERGLRGQGANPESHNEPGEVPWASGCSLFFAAEVFDIVGPIDQRYFMYQEDVDWCLTARGRGVPVLYEPRARIWHAVSDSVRGLDARITRYYDCRNYFLLVSKHGGAVGRTWAALRFALTAAKIALRTAVSPAHRRDAYYHAQTRALCDAIRGRWGQAPYDDAPRLEPHLEQQVEAVR